MFTESYQDNLLHDLEHIETALEDAQDNPEKLDHLILFILEFREKIERVLREDGLIHSIPFQISSMITEIISMLQEIYTQETYSRVDIFLARVRMILDPSWRVDIPEPIALDNVWVHVYSRDLSGYIIDIGVLQTNCQHIFPGEKEFVQLLRQYAYIQLIIHSLVRRFPGDTMLPEGMKTPRVFHLVKLYTYIQARDPEWQEMIVHMLHSMLNSLKWIQRFIATKKTTV